MSDRIRWTLIATSLLGFGALAHRAAGDSLLRGDVRVARWIQSRDWPLLDDLTDLANWSMRSAPLLVAGLICVVGLIRKRWWIESVVLASAALVMHASYTLKEIIASPRPTPDLVRIAERGESFGFPGGRAGNAVLFIGALTWIIGRHVESRAERFAVWIAAGLWIVLTGVARIRVGAHWPSDILGAWLWTIPALLVITTLANRLDRRRLS